MSARHAALAFSSAGSRPNPGRCQRTAARTAHAHLDRIVGFNSGWNVQVYAGPDSWDRMLAQRPGDVVILAGDWVLGADGDV